MDYGAIRKVIQTHFNKLITERKNKIATSGQLDTIAKAALLNTRDFSQQELNNNFVVHLGADSNILSIIEQYNLPITIDTPAYKTLQNEFLKACRDYAQEILAYDESLNSYNFTTSVYDTDTAPIMISNLKIADLIEDHLIYAKRTANIAEKTANEKRESLNLLIDILTPKDTIHLTDQDARDVYNSLLSIPKHLKTKPAFKGMSIHDVIALPTEHPLKKNNLLADATITKHLTHYNSFLAWAVFQGHTQDNPFERLKTPSKSKKPSVERKPFTKEQAALLVKCALDEKKPHYKWSTLIGLYTGARLEEIAQLHLSDIICDQETGIWYFDINDENEKNLKNSASARRVPIHNNLIKYGLLDYHAELINKKQSRLFPELTKTSNGYGRNISRWFNGQFLSKLGLKTPDLVFHSLRHTVATQLDQKNIEHNIVQRILGHSPSNVTQKTYTHGTPLQKLSDALNLLPY